MAVCCGDAEGTEPRAEAKFYGPGVGLLEAIALNGGSEDLQLCTVQHNQ